MKDKQRRIIESARARFRHYGIQKTTMQEIADDAGVAVGTLYRYFKDKDDLVIACAGEFASRHQEIIDEVLGSKRTPEEKIRHYVVERYRACREVGTSSKHAADLARAVLRLKPDRLLEEAQMMQSCIEKILGEGCERSIFHCTDLPRDAKVFLISLYYFFPNASMNVPQWPAEEDLHLVIDWFLESWRAEDRASAESASGPPLPDEPR